MKLSPADIANIEAMLDTGAYASGEAAVREALQSHRHMIEAWDSAIEEARSDVTSPAEAVFDALRARLEARLAGGGSG